MTRTVNSQPVNATDEPNSLTKPGEPSKGSEKGESDSTSPAQVTTGSNLPSKAKVETTNVTTTATAVNETMTASGDDPSLPTKGTGARGRVRASEGSSPTPRARTKRTTNSNGSKRKLLTGEQACQKLREFQSRWKLTNGMIARQLGVHNITVVYWRTGKQLPNSEKLSKVRLLLQVNA